MAIYEATIRSTSIPPGGTYNVLFTVGVVPAIFYNRTVGFSGTAGDAVVYEAPSGITGGTDVIPYVTDQTDLQVNRGQMYAGVSVTAPGTQRSARSYYRGSGSPGPSVVGTYSTAAGSRRLKPQTAYILQFTNSDASAQVIDLYFRWYEGPQEHPGGV